MRYLTELILISLIICSSCGSPSGGTDLSGLEQAPDEKIIADAYLFDAKIIQNKKVTSVRLEFYKTTGLIGINGRGYLGKGALKGHLSKDHLKVYFPHTNEYLDETIAAIFNSFKCDNEIKQFDLFSLFEQLPENIITEESFLIDITKAEPKRRTYHLSFEHCPWAISITYDLKGSRWLIKKFNFNDGISTELKGTRREYRPEAKVKISRFNYNPPSDAKRIIP